MRMYNTGRVRRVRERERENTRIIFNYALARISYAIRMRLRERARPDCTRALQLRRVIDSGIIHARGHASDSRQKSARASRRMRGRREDDKKRVVLMGSERRGGR